MPKNKLNLTDIIGVRVNAEDRAFIDAMRARAFTCSGRRPSRAAVVRALLARVIREIREERGEA